MTILSIMTMSHDQNGFHAMLGKKCFQSHFALGTVADPEDVRSNPPLKHFHGEFSGKIDKLYEIIR